MTAAAAHGRWIAASKALGRDVPVTEPYPHICGRRVAAEDTLGGHAVRLKRRDCGACAAENAPPPRTEPEETDNGTTS